MLKGPESMRVPRQDRVLDLPFTGIVRVGEMTGADLAREASDLAPDLKIDVTSIFAEASVQNNCLFFATRRVSGVKTDVGASR